MLDQKSDESLYFEISSLSQNKNEADDKKQDTSTSLTFDTTLVNNLDKALGKMNNKGEIQTDPFSIPIIQNTIMNESTFREKIPKPPSFNLMSRAIDAYKPIREKLLEKIKIENIQKRVSRKVFNQKISDIDLFYYDKSKYELIEGEEGDESMSSTICSDYEVEDVCGEAEGGDCDVEETLGNNSKCIQEAQNNLPPSTSKKTKILNFLDVEAECSDTLSSCDSNEEYDPEEFKDFIEEGKINVADEDFYKIYMKKDRERERKELIKMEKRYLNKKEGKTKSEFQFIYSSSTESSEIEEIDLDQKISFIQKPQEPEKIDNKPTMEDVNFDRNFNNEKIMFNGDKKLLVKKTKAFKGFK